MLKEIYYFINYVTAPLYKVIFSTDYFFIDYWSFLHLISGILIICFLKHYNYRRPFFILIFLLTGWEIIEISFIYFSIKIFNPETIPDQFTDMFIGFSGGIIMWFLPLPGKIAKPFIMNSIKSIEAILSCSISFVWVGFYGYRYNVEFFNSPYINWLAFVLWSSGLFLTIKVYKILDKFFTSLWKKILSTWLIYFAGLLVIEYFGYYVFEIRQVTYESPLIFGLIHGTVILKIYYVFSGILTVLIYNLLQNIMVISSTSAVRKGSYRYKHYDNS